jgi:hypothetical protein
MVSSVFIHLDKIWTEDCVRFTEIQSWTQEVFSGVEGCVKLYSPQNPSQSTPGLLQGTPRDTYISMNLNLEVGRGLVWSDQYAFWYTTQNV